MVPEHLLILELQSLRLVVAVVDGMLVPAHHKEILVDLVVETVVVHNQPEVQMQER